jgi:hypothetical protein
MVSISHRPLFDSNTFAVSLSPQFRYQDFFTGSSWPIYATKHEPVSARFRASPADSSSSTPQRRPSPSTNLACLHSHLDAYLEHSFFNVTSFRASPLSIQRRTSCLTLHCPITLSHALSCQCRACLQLRPHYLHPSSSPTQHVKFHNPKLCPFILFHAGSRSSSELICLQSHGISQQAVQPER